ncbi:MAG: hemolysin family protein [Lacipirellulaceae bacterium]
MTGDPVVWLFLASLGFTCLTAVGARALRDFSRSDLQEVCERNDRLDRFSEILHRHEPTALGLELLGVIASAICVAAGACWALARPGAVAGPSVSFALSAGATIGCGLAAVRIWLPWSLSRLYAEPVLFHSWPLWRLLALIAAPLLLGARLVDTVFHRLAGRTPDTPDEDTIEEEIRTIVSEGHREGLLEEDAREMIEGVIELNDADVSQIMTPRTDMHMLHVDLPWDELLADIIAVGHTRIPVFDGTRDDIVGVLYVKDLLPVLAKGPESRRRSIRELARKPIFVPETKRVNDLLKMLLQQRTHIAIVLDEYGGVSGLVTIEDVLEEIVGEIVDEYDVDTEEEIRRLGDDAFEAVGRAHVDEINDAMGTDLPEDRDYDTIAGFVFTELGRVPSVGETVDWNGELRVTVLEASKRRIERVRVERLAAPANGAV